MAEAGLLCATASWGSTFFLTKGALDSVHPVALVGHRFTLAAVLLAPWALRRERPERHLREGAGLGAVLCLLYLTQTVGLRYTTAANSGFLTGLFVLFVPVFLYLGTGARPEPGQWTGVGLALGGLWVLTGPPLGFNRGDFLTVVAAMAYAAHLLGTDRFVRGDADPVLLAFHQFWVCGLASLTLAAAGGMPMGVGRPALPVLLFLTLVPTVWAFFVQLYAQRRVSAMRVALVFSLEPVFAAAFAWSFGGEVFLPRSALGGALIVAGMVLGEVAASLKRGGKGEVLPV